MHSVPSPESPWIILICLAVATYVWGTALLRVVLAIYRFFFVPKEEAKADDGEPGAKPKGPRKGRSGKPGARRKVEVSATEQIARQTRSGQP